MPSPKSLAVMILMSLLLLSASPARAVELTYTDFLEQLVDLDSLPLINDGVECKQFSSYDRNAKYDAEKDEYINWGANGDAGNYISVDKETGEALMADIKGPGCIYRFWSANPQGKIRFYLDGDEKPTYEFNHNDLYTGKVEPFVRPFAWQRAVVLGGGNPASDCYLPIPFARSCKVTADKAHGQYYHIGYKTFPSHWQVETFHLPLTDEEKAKLQEVGKKWENCGEDPQPDPKERLKVSTKALTPGKEITVFELKGPATIKRLNMKLKSEDPFVTRNVLLKVYWDGASEPAVWCPAGDFFGRAYGEEPYASLPLGMADESDYCFWRMPFRKSAKITLTNEGTIVGSTAVCSVKYTEGEIAGRAAYFHAKWRREASSTTFDYPILECTGKGKFVGVMHFIDNIVGGWWGEGDEKVYVDGEKFPSTFGTGSEDYYGDAWGIRWFANPYHGCPQNEGRKQACYRWHISDSIPFSKEFTITIENYTAGGETHNGYTTVAYWYQMPGGTDFFKPIPVAERMPSPNFVAPEGIEAESLYDPSNMPRGVRILDDVATRDVFSWGRAVEYQGKAGAVFPITLDVANADNYSIELFAPSAEGAPPKLIPAGILHDGKPVVEKLWLEQGKQTFQIKLPSDFQGVRTVIVDYAVVRPWKNFIREWMVIGPFDNSDGKHAEAVYPPENEIDFSKTYKGKEEAEVKWAKETSAPNGFIDLRAIMGARKLPFENVLAYAVAYVESPDDREVEILTGTDDGVELWVNGKEVHENNVDRGASPDQDRAKAELKKGRNTILIKVDQGGGAWGFFLRIPDPEGNLTYAVE